MARFLTTLPTNTGFYNLSSVEAYPTGGTGPTAYGPTSYFGSDPLPDRGGDSVNNALNLGDLSAGFKILSLSNTHGGNTRIQSTFYKFILTSARSVQIIQNYSPNSYQSNTNRNTIISVYKIEEGTHRRELPINDEGCVYKETSIVDTDSYSEYGTLQEDYPCTNIEPGSYILLITNDIRYITTTYSFSINSFVTDWGSVTEGAELAFNFGLVSDPVDAQLDFGYVYSTAGTKSEYPYSATSGLGYDRDGVSP
jgi:hypothetical protein